MPGLPSSRSKAEPNAKVKTQWVDPLAGIAPSVHEVIFTPQQRERMAQYFDGIDALATAKRIRSATQAGARRINAQEWEWFYK